MCAVSTRSVSMSPPDLARSNQVIWKTYGKNFLVYISRARSPERENDPPSKCALSYFLDPDNFQLEGQTWSSCTHHLLEPGSTQRMSFDSLAVRDMKPKCKELWLNWPCDGRVIINRWRTGMNVADTCPTVSTQAPPTTVSILTSEINDRTHNFCSSIGCYIEDQQWLDGIGRHRAAGNQRRIRAHPDRYTKAYASYPPRVHRRHRYELWVDVFLERAGA